MFVLTYNLSLNISITYSDGFTRELHVLEFLTRFNVFGNSSMAGGAIFFWDWGGGVVVGVLWLKFFYFHRRTCKHYNYKFLVQPFINVFNLIILSLSVRLYPHHMSPLNHHSPINPKPAGKNRGPKRIADPIFWIALYLFYEINTYISLWKKELKKSVNSIQIDNFNYNHFFCY